MDWGYGRWSWRYFRVGRRQSIQIGFPLAIDSPNPITTPTPHATAYWKGRVVGAICCRLEDHIVPGCVRVDGWQPCFWSMV